MAGIIFPEFIYFAAFAFAYWLLPLTHQSWMTFLVGGIAYSIGYVIVLWSFALSGDEKVFANKFIRMK